MSLEHQVTSQGHTVTSQDDMVTCVCPVTSSIRERRGSARGMARGSTKVETSSWRYHLLVDHPQNQYRTKVLVPKTVLGVLTGTKGRRRAGA
eukprot:2881801-Rhodomonas_salina.1